ncbi:hypothetical protein CUT44_12465 [Streptomyces carminius]|uniref:Uncharacterized protein n=1 Tax=Streptomyces carminius TaxID=2665496 RepID=A0A2M8LZW2_9ACTN|nr:hypothetical protein [Streptomyces carminius]PJE97488.1 hypothetical protein CUT44_12465 [Streptomyces carminius]
MTGSSIGEPEWVPDPDGPPRPDPWAGPAGGAGRDAGFHAPELLDPDAPPPRRLPRLPGLPRLPRLPETPVLPPRLRRAVRLWGTVAAVFAVFLAGTAYGILRLERGDVPGLATEDDGRWDFPALVLPALPSGSPPPFAPDNPARIHHADLRDLLLPAPAGTVEGSPDPDGEWITVEEHTRIHSAAAGEELRRRLLDDAVRHITARGWTMPDGTRTDIRLLRFNTAAIATAFHADLLTGSPAPGTALRWGPRLAPDDGWPSDAGPDGVEVGVHTDVRPRGRTTRLAYLLAGDTVGVVVQTARGAGAGKPSPAEVPFRQTVILQAQLLG